MQRPVYCECTKTVADCQSQSSECLWLCLHSEEFHDVFTLSKIESKLQSPSKLSSVSVYRPSFCSLSCNVETRRPLLAAFRPIHHVESAFKLTEPISERNHCSAVQLSA